MFAIRSTLITNRINKFSRDYKTSRFLCVPPKAMLQNGFRAALIQSLVGKDRTKNLENAAKLIHQAKSKGAQVVALPECFNSPYGTKFFNEYAESVPEGPTCKMLSEAARKHSIYIIGYYRE